MDRIPLTVVGLDGASENMIGEYLDELPVLEGIMDDGAGGSLESTSPPITFPAWTTFATGKNPGKHGVYNMTQLESNYDTPPASPNESEGALYDALDDAVFVNVPATYPRSPRGDALLVRGNAPSPEAAVPERIADWQEARRYRVARRPELKPEPDEYVGDIATIEEKRFRLVERACEEYEPEFLFVLVSGPDWLFHYLGQRGDPSQIPELFGEFERYLDWFRENSRNLMLMSDHGFERKRTAVYPNKILQRAGLLTPETGDQDAMQVLANVIKGLTKRSDLFYEVVRRTYHLLIHTEFSDDLYEAAKLAVEYGETAVWHHRDELVYVNDDRFDEPRVTDDEYATVRDQAIGALAGATDPETGRDLFADVSAGEAVYDGDAGRVPNVVAEPNEGVIAYRTPMQDDVAAPTDTYDHRRDGLFYCVGDAFADAETTAGIADIAPTVLHLLGRPVPRDMDGRVITEVLNDAGEIEEGDPIEPGTVGARGAAEEAELTERLADLGYLE